MKKCIVCGEPTTGKNTVFYAMVEGYTKIAPICPLCKEEHGSHYYELD